jgi:hypothetical protein
LLDILKVPPDGKPPEKPELISNPPSPSKSIPPTSYFFLFSLSDKQAYASATSLNFLVAYAFSASDLSVFRSG